MLRNYLDSIYICEKTGAVSGYGKEFNNLLVVKEEYYFEKSRDEI